MPLQTSGAISLNDIHVEAGGTSGTQASINDSDIRALIGKASGATMSFSEWYGASFSLEEVTVTAGSATIFFNTWTGFQNFLSPNIGSVSDSTFSPKSATYAGLYHIAGSNTLNFRLDGTLSNADWTSMVVGGAIYTRTSATFTQTGGDTLWYWGSVSTSPFTAGSNTTVTWV